ncbi:Uncharacterized protein TCM_020659 [Theobroma cacao]|uniref:Bifunctional inhibitor/lipid-transfer protein/seed storage 2S albumin superfamily protein n=1 Tax=Theobroma cacao TaxID=3641 RepID=A0A061EM82_THECC|nr:Uncharacterized protein TCM_020659 [Theobroma cacao]
MGLRGLQVSLVFTWLLAIVLFKLAPMFKSQMQGCSVQDVDLGQCFNQGINSSIEIACCKALNQVVQTGYNCLCSLLSSFIAPSSTPLSLPLSNCYISVPSLTLCRDSPERNLTLPSAPSIDVLAPPAQDQIQVPLNLTEDNNHAEEQRKPHSIENSVPALYVSDMRNGTSNGKEKTKMLAHQISLLLSLALQGCILLA